jgi:hypothetical protein
VPIVDAEGARTIRHDLEETARHDDVLDEVERLVGIGEVGVEEHRRSEAEQGEDGGNDARLTAQDYERPATDLDGNSSNIGQGGGNGSVED